MSLQAWIQGLVKLVFLLALYCGWDYVLGFLVTKLGRVLLKQLGMPTFRFTFEWISVHWGLSELTVAVGPFCWLNPPQKGFEEANFVSIRRMAVRLKPASVVGALLRGEPIEVRNVEVEGVTVLLERTTRHGLNLWACLGVTEAQGEDLRKKAEMEKELETEYEAFEELGDDATGLPKSPAASAPAADDGPRLLVWRVCLRGVKAHIDAFLTRSTTRSVTSSSALKIDVEILQRALRPARRTKRGPLEGLTVPELVSRVVSKIIDRVVASNKVALLKTATNAAIDQSAAATRQLANATAKGTMNTLSNMTHTSTAKVHERLSHAALDAQACGGASQLAVRVISAKHLDSLKGGKPSAYLKLQIGKKGVKAKSSSKHASHNPDWKETLLLAPVESLDLDLRVQVYDKSLFSRDDQLGATIRIPLRERLELGKELDAWFVVPQGPDEDLVILTNVSDDPRPVVHLSLLLT